MLIDKRLQNRELNLREYELRLSTLKSRPRAVFVELTQNCNLRCFMCKPAGSLRQGYYPELDMPYPLFEQIAEALFPTAELIDLRGQGESTILRDFWRYFDRTISYGVRVRLVTNLTMTDPSVLEKLVANDALLAISMDAPNRELYEEIRKGSRYDVVIANLELLQSLRNEYQKSADTRIHMILYRRNLALLSDMLRLAHRYQVGHVLIWPMELPANNGDNVIYHLEEAYRSIGDAFQLADKLGLELRIGDWLTRPLEPATKILKHTTCIRPWMYIAVGYNGQIGLCDCHTSPSSLHGARFSDGPLEEIWNGEDYQNVRRAMAVGISEIARLDTGCSKCALRKLVDFDEEIYPAASQRIVSNRYPGLLKG